MVCEEEEEGREQRCGVQERHAAQFGGRAPSPRYVAGGMQQRTSFYAQPYLKRDATEQEPAAGTSAVRWSLTGATSAYTPQPCFDPNG